MFPFCLYLDVYRFLLHTVYITMSFIKDTGKIFIKVLKKKKTFISWRWKKKQNKNRLTNKCPLERTIFPHQKSVSYFFLSCWARGSFFSLSNKLFVSHFNNWNVAMNLITSIILEILYILNCIIAVYLIFLLRKFW